MMSTQGLQVAAAMDPLTRLRIFTEHVIVVDIVLGLQVSRGGSRPVLL